MDNVLYQYSPIVERPKLAWPKKARIAFYAGLNIEHYEVDKPSTSIFQPERPDLLPIRSISALARLRRAHRHLANDGRARQMQHEGVRAAEFAERRPGALPSDHRSRQQAQLGVGRAPGKNNSTLQAPGMTADAERKYLAEVVQTISAATGQDIKGWVGPALSETFETPRLLKELGLRYVLDWCSDDQPFPLLFPGLSMPYSIELNDVTMFVGKEF